MKLSQLWHQTIIAGIGSLSLLASDPVQAQTSDYEPLSSLDCNLRGTMEDHIQGILRAENRDFLSPEDQAILRNAPLIDPIKISLIEQMLSFAAEQIETLTVDPDVGYAYYPAARQELLCAIQEQGTTTDQFSTFTRDTYRNTLLNIMMRHAQSPEDFLDLFATLEQEKARIFIPFNSDMAQPARIAEKFLFEIRHTLRPDAFNPLAASFIAEALHQSITNTQSSANEEFELRAALNALSATSLYAPQFIPFLTEWVLDEKPHANVVVSDLTRYVAEQNPSAEIAEQLLNVYDHALDNPAYYYEDIAAAARGLSALARRDNTIGLEAQDILINAINNQYANIRAHAEGVQGLRMATLGAESPERQKELLGIWNTLLQTPDLFDFYDQMQIVSIERDPSVAIKLGMDEPLLNTFRNSVLAYNFKDPNSQAPTTPGLD